MGNNPRILIVEDQNIVALDIQNRLMNLNYVVTGVASSGAGAIKKAEDTKPDLVLMDIMLKGDMDGIGASQQIRSRLNIPVVYLTAYADANTLQRAKVTEPFGYILKPFEEKELQTTIEMALYRHKMEKQLREREHWFATTLKSIREAVITTDKELNITFINNIAEKILNCTNQEVLDKNINSVIKVINEKSKVVYENYFSKIDFNNDKPDNLLISVSGKERYVSKNISAIKNDDDEIIGYAIIFKDITDKLITDDKKNKNEKLEVLNKFSYSIANEFSKFLTVISGNISLAKIKTDLNDKRYIFLNEAEEEIFKANEFINELIKFSNISEPEKKSVSLNYIFEKTIKPILREYIDNVEIENIREIYTEIDEKQINQVLEIVLDKIIELNKDKSKIDINIETIKSDSNTKIPFLSKSNYILLNFKFQNKNNNLAFSDFDSYFYKDLKLPIAYSIISKNNGFLNIDTSEDYTKFQIYLQSSGESDNIKKATFNKDLRGSEKIIIMDDEPTLLDITESMLTDMGYTVDQSKNGEELINMYTKAYDMNNPYDIVVMDLTIPGGMGGKEAIKEIINIDPKAKVILCSGYSNDPILHNYREFGFSGVLTKPFRIRDLIHKIRDVLDDKT